MREQGGLASIFRGIFRTAIPLLKGPTVRVSIGLAEDMLLGKSMTQALTNRVAPFIGGVMKAAGAEGGPGGGKRKPRRAAKRSSPSTRPASAKKRRSRNKDGSILSSK